MNQLDWQLLEDHHPAESVRVNGVELKRGDMVRLRPGAGGDIFDLALAGKDAIIDSIEQDYEGNCHLAVILEDDPGRDLGALRQPGHRFFFRPEEVEPAKAAPRILIAGIGNIFLGDDAFGIDVLRRLPSLAANITVKDFGIRGYDLAYALLDGYDAVILVDAAPRGEAPGTLYVMEPSLKDSEPGDQAEPALDAHAMTPAGVLRLAKSLGGQLPARILLVGCEPASLGGEEGYMGLSDPVSAAVDPAVALIEQLIAEDLRRKEGAWNGSVANQ